MAGPADRPGAPSNPDAELAPTALRADVVRLGAAAFLRTTGVGLSGTLLLVTLWKAGLGDREGWTVLAAGLVGSATGLALVARHADRFGRRRCLRLAAMLSALGAGALALLPVFPLAAFAAFLGLVNGMGRDRGPALALEQAMLPAATTARGRTGLFARYHVVLDVGHGVGALAAGLPTLFAPAFGLPEAAALRLTLGLLCPLNLAALFIYARLSPALEASAATLSLRLAPASRRVVARLSTLFALDSLGGGFIPNALLALWFYRRFDLDPWAAGAILACGRAANALSYLAAAWLAARIGLIRTMVFTHIPSSLVLLALPFVPSAPVAIGLYLLRELLVEMDLPTRQSFTMAVVAPHERTAAAGITGLVRAAAWAAGTIVATFVVPVLGLSAPLVIGAALKIVYDVLLYFAMRGTRPPEER